MKTPWLISASLVLLVGACTLDEDTTRSTGELINLGGQTQSACTVSTPTSWIVNGKRCTSIGTHTYGLGIGDSLELTTLWLGDHLTFYCSETGLVVVEEVCEFGS